MKENKNKRFSLPSNRFLAALVVVALTIASLGVTMTLLGCEEPGTTTPVFCSGCAKQISGPTAHQASCGVSGHYSCDGNEHSKELCAPDSGNAGHTHTFGDATCIAPATCTVAGCTETSGQVNASNHTGGTELKNEEEPTCCEAGYSGDTYCKGCGQKIQDGSAVPATEDHPAAECSKSGHHTHDQKDHSEAECLILGHFVCDGKDHTDWMCLSNEEQNNIVSVEVTIANPDTVWSYTIGGHTINNENIESYEHEVLLGGYSIKVFLTTIQGYTFTIDATGGKKVYIADYSENAGYNDMIINGEDPVTITVSTDMLMAETYGEYTYYTLFVTIKDPA